MSHKLDLRAHVFTQYITKQVIINPDYPYKSNKTYLVEDNKVEHDVYLKLDFKMFILETLKFLLKKENDYFVLPYEIDYNKINTRIVYNKIHSLLELTEYSKVLEIFDNNQLIFEKKIFEEEIINLFRKEYNQTFHNIHECINHIDL